MAETLEKRLEAVSISEENRDPNAPFQHKAKVSSIGVLVHCSC